MGICGGGPVAGDVQGAYGASEGTGHSCSSVFAKIENQHGAVRHHGERDGRFRKARHSDERCNPGEVNSLGE